MKVTIATTAILLSALAARAPAQTQDAPSRTPPPEASQFDYLLGTWDFTATYTRPDGQAERRGVWHAEKTLDGFAVMDEWRLIDADDNTLHITASFRIYDPALGKWNMRALNVFAGVWTDQYAEHRDGEMHLEWSGTDRFGDFKMRVRYYDIEADRFSWMGDRSYDNGETWMEGWLAIEATRTRHGGSS